MSQLSVFRNFLELFKHKNEVFNGGLAKKSIHYLCKHGIENVPCDHRLLSLGQPGDAKGDPRDVFLIPTSHSRLSIYTVGHKLSITLKLFQRRFCVQISLEGNQFVTFHYPCLPLVC